MKDEQLEELLREIGKEDIYPDLALIENTKNVVRGDRNIFMVILFCILLNCIAVLFPITLYILHFSILTIFISLSFIVTIFNGIAALTLIFTNTFNWKMEAEL